MMLRLILVFVISYSAHAEVFKWTDAEGNVHYGDRPASAGSVDEIEMQLPIVDSGIDNERAESRERVLDVFQEDREALEKQRREAQKKKLKRKKKCNRLKKKYQRLKNAKGVYKRGEGDDRNYLSFKKRAELEARYRKAISKNCK